MSRSRHYFRRYTGHKLWLQEKRDNKYGSRREVREQLVKEKEQYPVANIMDIPADIREYVDTAGQPGTVQYQFDYLAAAVEMGAVLQLDKPLVRVQRQDGTQAATLHVPTAEVVVATTLEEDE